jgi:hypothetical protein
VSHKKYGARSAVRTYNEHLKVESTGLGVVYAFLQG